MAASRNDDVAAAAAALGADDLMVFELDGDRARLRGGVGRGAGWAGIVELELTDEPLLRDAIDNGRVARVEAAEPVRIVGPYWAAHAAFAPVGSSVVVVGGTGPLRASSAELTRHATEAIAAVGEVPPSKLLADELELADAVRQLTDHTPRSLAEAASHIAEVAADSLSCEIGAVLFQRDGHTEVHGAGSAWPALAEDEMMRAALHDLAARSVRGPILEQDFAAVGGRGLRIVSCYALGIGRSETLGALVVGHTDARPRGFTQLCQRVGRALADAAEPALRLAMAHEDLAAQRDKFAREARTDLLTGLANRVGWEDTLAMESARWSRHPRPMILLSVDLDGLKEANDTHGHAIGDELLRAAATILRAELRTGDVVARVGGDEFAALLPDADGASAEIVRGRIRAAVGAWEGSVPGLRLALSIGWAEPTPDETLHEALRRADAAMYEEKRGAA